MVNLCDIDILIDASQQRNQFLQSAPGSDFLGYISRKESIKRANDGEDVWNWGDAWWYSFHYYAEAFNPLSWGDYRKYTTKRGLSQKAVAFGIPYTAAWIVSGPLSTGGSAPTLQQMRMLKVAELAELGQFVVRTGYHAGRYAARSVPMLLFASAAAFAVDMVANPLDSAFARGAEALVEAIDPWSISEFTFIN